MRRRACALCGGLGRGSRKGGAGVCVYVYGAKLVRVERVVSIHMQTKICRPRLHWD